MWSPQQNTISYSLSCKILPCCVTHSLSDSRYVMTVGRLQYCAIQSHGPRINWLSSTDATKSTLVLWMPTARFTREELRIWIGYRNRNVSWVSSTYWDMKMGRYLGHQESLFDNICRDSSEGLEEEASLSCSCGVWYRLLIDPVPWIVSWGALGIARAYL
jgi:hypothetical protein